MLTRIIRSLLMVIGVCIVVLAIYRVFGGDIGALLNGLGNFFWLLIDGGADALAKLFNSAKTV